MHNLFIIGNGFDLAHNLRTTYNDFLLDLYQKVIKSPDSYKDIADPKSQSILEKKNSGKLAIDQKIWMITLIQLLVKASTHNYWSDIEYLYFKILNNYNNLKFFEENFGYNFHYKDSRNVNEEFDKIKKYLEFFLIEEQSKFRKINAFEYLFSKYNDSRTTILNFNYTNTIREYLIDNKSIQHINIHGELNNEENPIIFGFAANDDESKILIDKNDNELMRNVKKINYSLTKNELKLKEQMSKPEHFDVFIIGHSCGISDKLILNQIFNHPKVNSIRPFYYNGKDGYKQLVINIDRIIDDYSKADGQKKSFPRLLNYPDCQAIIQFDSDETEVKKFKSYVDKVSNDQKIYRKNRDAMNTVFF